MFSIIASCLAIAAVIFLLGLYARERIADRRFGKLVERLFSGMDIPTGELVDLSRLSELPDPVQRYFKLVLKEGQPIVACARLKHDGIFRINQKANWTKINGEQYFTTKTPGFIWRGRTRFFSAIDMYIANKGRLVVSLLSLLKIVDLRGTKANLSELQRWLAESVWFPTNLLPSEKIAWGPIDANTAKLTFHHLEMPLYYTVEFNDKGEIIQFRTKRYQSGKELVDWIGKPENYQEINGMQIPMKIEAIWKLDKGEFSYAKFNVLNIDFNIPGKYI